MVSSLRISPDLLAQLKRDAGAPGADASRTTQVPQSDLLLKFSRADAQTRAAIEKSKELQSALMTSESVGGLLLKNEDNELAKVKEKVSHLMASEFSANQKAPPCASERGAVVECYKLNPGNELKCAHIVSAYQHCADEAFKASTLAK
jgi:hypothetical protein